MNFHKTTEDQRNTLYLENYYQNNQINIHFLFVQVKNFLYVCCILMLKDKTYLI